MRDRILGLAILIILLILGSTACSSETDLELEGEAGPEYQNPVFEPVIADPSIIKADDGFYYVYGTEDNWGDGMGSRVVPIVRSENLVDWEYVGEAFHEKPSWKEDGGIWAPDIVYFNDKYYLYYSQSTWGDANPAIGVATSDTPKGPFEDQGKVFDSKEIGVNNSIDPQLFIDDDGTPYLFWGSWYGIWGIEMSEDGFDHVGEKFQIAGTAFEAPYIIKRDDYYYFFGSKGSCCEGQWSQYRVAIGRSDSLKGPYVDKNGSDIIRSTGTLILQEGEQFVGPGHNAIVTDEAGQDWMIYHAIDKDEAWIGSGVTRRPLMLDKVIWEDGWPTIEGGVPGEGVQEGPITEAFLSGQ
ncbi:family 43 glycosylhydrolase [Evansella cellulosilytica]|uniref:Endo-alpha-(1->5)-L-arabinanase n=1 Tax=Evansella cellulosilytica (strain ATCC 21833 / DSM 2522 / FERM P-1141 / JCM 9156 / N-4) TaxID=649639 RepID=E6TQD4_EVAC2|nr:family 43 glycosylhydrolase [Evansella cellulosilytica]ADU29312.1 glycoside hydrolase family 43 [Evansella cellulosilytica DSM 2522]